MHIPLLYQIIVQSHFKYKQELIKLDLSAENEESVGCPNRKLRPKYELIKKYRLNCL